MRVLLSSGGEYEELPMTSEGSNSTTGGGGGRSMRWRYVGGETRLVGLSRTQSFSAFLQQLAKATSAVWDEVRRCFVFPSLCTCSSKSMQFGCTSSYSCLLQQVSKNR